MTFLTDPKHNDYAAERNMSRNVEPWREAKLAEETEEERLDRLEREEGEKDPMKELEEKAMDAQMEMKIADKLDEIRTRNARLERREREGGEVVREKTGAELERERLDREDEEEAKRAFQSATGEKVKRVLDVEDEREGADGARTVPATTNGVNGNAVEEEEKRLAVPSFARTKKRKVNHAAALGIQQKEEPKPTVVEEDDFW